MAWQLIYTSAERLLDAGRTGFGTVARHRQIPAGLVAVVERNSQFNRVPGLDDRRIIYSHRHLVLGSTRYHLLSRIRATEADYTGRTNHIAHHLIIERREMQALTAAGITPADILLSDKIAWFDRWQGVPCYFDEDGLDLTAIDKGCALPAQWWGALTGDSGLAALLYSAEALRGCYVIWPDNPEDSLQFGPLCLFGESLLLRHERAWEMTFTTNLQPSDEVGDLLWRGLSADSPLRQQAEQSGRLIINLASPSGLPLPDNDELAKLGRGERPSASSPLEQEAPQPLAGQEYVERDLPSAAAFKEAVVRPVEPLFQPIPQKRKKHFAMLWGIPAAAVFVALAALLLFYRGPGEREKIAEEINLQLSKLRAGHGVDFDQARFFAANKHVDIIRLKDFQVLVGKLARYWNNLPSAESPDEIESARAAIEKFRDYNGAMVEGLVSWVDKLDAELNPKQLPISDSKLDLPHPEVEPEPKSLAVTGTETVYALSSEPSQNSEPDVSPEVQEVKKVDEPAHPIYVVWSFDDFGKIRWDDWSGIEFRYDIGDGNWIDLIPDEKREVFRSGKGTKAASLVKINKDKSLSAYPELQKGSRLVGYKKKSDQPLFEIVFVKGQGFLIFQKQDLKGEIFKRKENSTAYVLSSDIQKLLLRIDRSENQRWIVVGEGLDEVEIGLPNWEIDLEKRARSLAHGISQKKSRISKIEKSLSTRIAPERLRASLWEKLIEGTVSPGSGKTPEKVDRKIFDEKDSKAFGKYLYALLDAVISDLEAAKTLETNKSVDRFNQNVIERVSVGDVSSFDVAKKNIADVFHKLKKNQVLTKKDQEFVGKVFENWNRLTGENNDLVRNQKIFEQETRELKAALPKEKEELAKLEKLQLLPDQKYMIRLVKADGASVDVIAFEQIGAERVEMKE